jgi:hypothetical protein
LDYLESALGHAVSLGSCLVLSASQAHKYFDLNATPNHNPWQPPDQMWSVTLAEIRIHIDALKPETTRAFPSSSVKFGTVQVVEYTVVMTWLHIERPISIPLFSDATPPAYHT